MTIETFLDIMLVVMLIICTITDLKVQKIYNGVVFPALLASFAIHTMFNGIDGLLFCLMGFGTGFLLLLIPYAMGGMGAGDVKLMAAIGAMKGAAFILVAFLYIAVLGGLIALFIVLSRKPFWINLKYTVISLALLRRGIRVTPVLAQGASSIVYPYGIAIAAGTVAALGHMGGWFG